MYFDYPSFTLLPSEVEDKALLKIKAPAGFGRLSKFDGEVSNSTSFASRLEDLCLALR